MSATPPPARPASDSYPPHEAARLRRIRRYAVPPWMIDRATERRLAGDWRGACAAANVDVTFDLADLANSHGDAVAAAIEDDLRHFAPDLLRWHLPRLDRGRITIVPDQVILLGRPGDDPDAPCLYLRTPRWMAHGPQRLRLQVGEVHRQEIYLETDWTYSAFWRNVVQDWSSSRHLWDARHTGELRERCGGDKARAPFLHGDGTPRGAGELPAADPGHGDPAAFAEWVTLLHERGEVEAAFAAAGIELDTALVAVEPYYELEPLDPRDVLARMPIDVARLASEVRRLAAATGTGRFWLPYRQYAAILFETDGPDSETGGPGFEPGGPDAGLRVRFVEFEMGTEPADLVLPEACWRRLPDLDLLRDGHPPERLHPLVHEALFPDRALDEAPPDEPEPPRPVRVRCRGEWHEVSFRDGVLHIPHSEQEQQRESAMRVFGGAIAGCFAARHAWTSGTGRLPKALRQQRSELFTRAQHGDLPGVLRLLDAGLDPRVRDDRQRTLLHLLHLLDPGVDPSVRGTLRQEAAHRLRHLGHDGLLGRLLAAGLDIDATDESRRTPLFAAICGDGSVALIEALLTAGARIDLCGEIHDEPVSLHRLISWLERDDLHFIVDRIEREHPELAEEE
ncbi:ankyrin repeat domain-containing protein [Nonomuraea sp. NN258]|uniref:ankyrin repeat domain-containing protein n=1 Tax=Nonomuraea antri TaxID=2730852 RepID=UPI0015693984|nr:ankyrin repeat domain-containing protein [Nonomuraea antri]NRQ30863.1 ankyrin repeat domain-containing protein [Nonomuraea antri]